MRMVIFIILQLIRSIQYLTDSQYSFCQCRSRPTFFYIINYSKNSPGKVFILKISKNLNIKLKITENLKTQKSSYLSSSINLVYSKKLEDADSCYHCRKFTSSWHKQTFFFEPTHYASIALTNCTVLLPYFTLKFLHELSIIYNKLLYKHLVKLNYCKLLNWSLF